jgi:hypothetical protein
VERVIVRHQNHPEGKAMLKTGPNTIFAAQIDVIDRAKLRYQAMLSAGSEERGAAEGESFATPQEALRWLKDKMAIREGQFIAGSR